MLPLRSPPTGSGSELILRCGLEKSPSPSHGAELGPASTAGQAWAAAGGHAARFPPHPGPSKPPPAGPPPTRLCCTGGEVPEARSTQAACSNAGQTAGWIFHGGSQTKALGSVFLKK